MLRVTHDERSSNHFLTLTCVHVCLTLSLAGWTKRIIGIPKAESDAVLAFLYAQIAENYDFQVRYKWETNDVAIWDNRVTLSSSVSSSPSSPFLLPFVW